MAKTLKDFQKEFEAIKKEAHAATEEMEELENNLGALLDQMTEGFKVLGARVGELRSQGLTGGAIASYMGDPQVARMVQELQRRRDQGKTAGARAEHLYNQNFLGLRKRLKTLREGLAAEIVARKKNFSSKALGVNRSVKEMEPLSAEVVAYGKASNPAWTMIASPLAAIPADQFDEVYDNLMTEQINKSAKEVRKDEKLTAALHQLNDKVMAANTRKAMAGLKEVNRQAKLGATAQKLKDGAGLARVKTAGGNALKQVKDIVEPYEKIMANKTVKEKLAHSPDEPMIAKGVKTLFDVKKRAEDLYEELNARTLVQ